jgi:transposase
MSDHDIADYVGVSIMTINRWKKKNNIPKFKYTLTNAKGRDYNG